MPAPAEIVQLVELFQRNYDQYRAPAFTEVAARHASRSMSQTSICTRGWPRRSSRTMPKAGCAPAAHRDDRSARRRRTRGSTSCRRELTPEEIKVVEGAPSV
jgi:hypothetical protein